MPTGEEPEDRVRRRAAVQGLKHFADKLDPPIHVSRDAGHLVLQPLVEAVWPTLCDAEKDNFRAAVAAWMDAANSSLELPEEDATMAGQQPGPDLPDGRGDTTFRIHAADVQLTFNCKTWVPEGTTVAEWFEKGGVTLAGQFQHWALVTIRERFKEEVSHCSLTMEESLAAEKPQVHLHAQLTFQTRIDRSSNQAFSFQDIRPHVVTNRARGRDVEASRARAHFYVYCNKRGTLWRYTDWWPFTDYEVNPHWLTSLWCLGKLDHAQYERYLLSCKKSFRTLQQNAQAVAAAEKTEAMKSLQAKVAAALASTRLPFRSTSDPLFPQLPTFFEQHLWVKDRYKMYALQGPSQAAKTSFAKALFRNPFVITVQGQRSLDLRGFEHEKHDALVLDNVNSFQVVLDHRALLQSNNDVHKLGESTTGIYSYSVYLWGVPIMITLDLDVDAKTELEQSEWLRANVLLDVLPQGATCYVQGTVNKVPKAAVKA